MRAPRVNGIFLGPPKMALKKDEKTPTGIEFKELRKEPKTARGGYITSIKGTADERSTVMGTIRRILKSAQEKGDPF